MKIVMKIVCVCVDEVMKCPRHAGLYRLRLLRLLGGAGVEWKRTSIASIASIELIEREKLIPNSVW